MEATTRKHPSSSSSSGLASGKRPTLYYDMSLSDYQSELFGVNANKPLQQRIAQGARDLAEHGYCVIENVVERELCEYAHASFWRTLEGASTGRLKQPTCAADLKGFVRDSNWPLNKHGILEHTAFSHLDFVHAVRTHPAVASIFAHFYGADRGLVVAPDRINYQLPNEWLPRATFDDAWIDDPDAIGNHREASWAHVDQSFTKKGLHCIQGLVVMEDADQPGDASLEVVAKSHLMHGNMEAILEIKHKSAAARRKDWYKFNAEDKELLESMGFFEDFRVVRAKRGDFIAWDSRATHQGGRIRAHAKKAPRPNPRPRFVVYVCMQPAWEPLTVAQVAKKIKIFTELKNTSHWPLASDIFKPPQTYGKEPPTFDFDKYVVKPLAAGSDDKLQVLKEFAGITQKRTLRFAPFDTKPLLAFDATSGMRPTHFVSGFTKRKFESLDDEELSNIEALVTGEKIKPPTKKTKEGGRSKRRRIGSDAPLLTSTLVNAPAKPLAPPRKKSSKQEEEEEKEDMDIVSFSGEEDSVEMVF